MFSLQRLSAAVGGQLLASGGAAWVAPALLASRHYATQIGKSLVFAEHGTPERVLRLEPEKLPPLGDHDVLINLLAVSAWMRPAQAAAWGAAMLPAKYS